MERFGLLPLKSNQVRCYLMRAGWAEIWLSIMSDVELLDSRVASASGFSIRASMLYLAR
jgi:hypothetical protein